MKMCHPDGTHITEVTRKQYLQIWSLRGWKVHPIKSDKPTETKKEKSK